MSEGTNSGAESSGTDSSEQEKAPSGKSKRNLWLMIAAVVVAALLVGTILLVLMKPSHSLEVNIVSPANAEAGEIVALSVTVTYDKTTSLTDTDDGVVIRWSVDPSSAGDFDLLAKSHVNMTAANSGMTATLKCKVTYAGLEKTDTATLTIKPPFLDSIAIVPSTRTVPVGEFYNFTATAVSSVGLPMTGVAFTWSVGKMSPSDYTLNQTTGISVKFTGLAVGNASLNATATVGGITKTGTASVIVSAEAPNRTVDYIWYDMFNVPFGQWWDQRWIMTHAEKPWSRTYPYIFEYHGSPPGNNIYYANSRLNFTARNLTEVNMNERPEFLPLFGTERGGNVVIDWYQQYLTQAEVIARIPLTYTWNDGWFINWKGTTTLDKQAAKAVMGITDAQFGDFANWWAANNGSWGTQYQDWITAQSSGRLDIHPAYDGDMNWIDWIIWCEKVGDSIVMHIDTVSWGMDMMMSRWMWDTFMPTEYYFEDFTFRARIGPERTDADVDTAVAYALLAAESKYVYPGRTHGDPVWYWAAQLQDYMFSEPPLHPHSLYDIYAGGPTSNGTVHYYPVSYPGSPYYGQLMSYDITPGAWNLSAGETLSFDWPSDEVTFVCQLYNSTGPVIGKTYNITANLTMDYAEPNATDFPSNFVVGDHTMTYIGPIDMWDWSHNQTNNTELESEWDSTWLLPRGVPYIEWKNESAAAPPHIDHFEVTGITSPIKGGTPASVTLRAFDQYGNVFTSYTGTVHFASSDLAASLPADYPFVAGDNGVHTFAGEVTFHNTGTVDVTQSVTVSDTVTTSATGQQTGIVVRPDPHANSLEISGLPGTITTGQLMSVTVTVKDQYGLVYTPYDGTVNFTSNRSDIVLPANHTFTVGDAGVHTFVSELNFTGLDYYSLTCVDVENASVNATKTGIFVVGAPSVVTWFAVYGPSQIDVDFASSIVVVAMNQYDRVFDTYNGTIHFGTNATVGQYTLPDNYTFVPGNMGNKTFTGGMIFNEPGWYAVDVVDIFNVTATGSLTGIHVMPRAPEIHYRMYDMFEEPFGQWWWGNDPWYKGRIVKYQTDQIVWNETHKHASLYNPNFPSDDHAVIMAPYHWSTDAKNITSVTVNTPYIMPANYTDPYGRTTTPVAGAEAQIDLRFQYVDNDSWKYYWMPKLGTTPFYKQFIKNQGDGYFMAVEYFITLNREAALQWLNLSLSETDVAGWWDQVGFDYQIYWRDWVINQGKVVYDIYSGYDDTFYDYFYTDTLTEDVSTGEIHLYIGYPNFGYEVLMTRWLTASGICGHEVYWENFTMNATMNTQFSDVHFDGTGTYNLHAVKANQSAGTDGAWVWEPTKIDYVPSNRTSVYHHSDFDPYFMLRYTSWNSGDTATYWGKPVVYDATPTRFNLTDYMTLTIELPKGSNVPCYKGQPVPVGSVAASRLGIVGNYTALEYNGTASLGFTIPDLKSMYDASSQTLTIDGPMNFDNPRGSTGLLYHSAPWIEFNVTAPPPLKTQSVIEPSASSGTQATGSVASELVAIVAVASTILFTVVLGRAERRLW